MRWLRVDEVLAALKTSPGAIYKLAHVHGWRTKKEGRHALYSLDDIESYLEKRDEK